MDNQTIKELEDLYAMREASRLNQQAILAEQLGTFTLRHIHPKPNLIRRIINKIRK